MGPVNNEKIIVKLRKLKGFTNEEEIRKVVLNAADEPMTLDELCLMCQRIFRLTANTDLFFKYQDQDGDWISLVDNSDLVLALLDSKNYLKLQVFEEAELENSTSTRISSINQSELKTIKNELNSIKIKISSIVNKLDGLECCESPRVDGMSSVGVKRDPIASGVVEIPSTADKELTASLNSGVGKEFDPLHLSSQSNFSSNQLEKSQPLAQSLTPPPSQSTGSKEHGVVSGALTGPPAHEIGDNQVNDLSLSSNMSPDAASNSVAPPIMGTSDSMGAMGGISPVAGIMSATSMAGSTGPGGSLHNSSSSLKSGMTCMADRNTLSSSPSSHYTMAAQQNVPPVSSVVGGGFKPNVYNPQTDDSNNLDAGGSPSDRQNVPDSGAGSIPPTMEVNSLNKSMHPQPPPSMMHPPPPTMMGGTMTRPPFNPPGSNFMPPFMPGMPPPSGRPGGTPPVTNDQVRPGGYFGPPPQSGVPNMLPPGPQHGYPQPPPSMMPGPSSGAGANNPPPTFPTVGGSDSSPKPPPVFNGVHPPPQTSSTATSSSIPSSTSNMQPPTGPLLPQGMMPPPMGGPPPSMQSMPPMNIPRGQMMYPGARYAMPSMPKGSSTPLQAPSSGDAPPVSSSANPATFNPVPSYGSSPFMPPTNYPAPRGSSGMPPPPMSMPAPPTSHAYGPPVGGQGSQMMMMSPRLSGTAPGYGGAPGAPSVSGAGNSVGGPPMMMPTGPPPSFPVGPPAPPVQM